MTTGSSKKLGHDIFNMRTSKRDRNFISFSDKMDGTGIDVVIEGHHFRVDQVLGLKPEKGEVYDAILKFSSASNASVLRPTTEVGVESGIDLNNSCKSLYIRTVIGEEGDECLHPVTCKASEDITLDITVKAKGKWCEIMLGDWSDESTKRTKGTILILREGGIPVRVICANANFPVFKGEGKGRVLFWASLCAKTYWWSKWVLVNTGFKWFPRLNKQSGT